MTQAQRRGGLGLARASKVLGEEPYYHEFVEGLERVLTPAGVSVLVKVVIDRQGIVRKIHNGFAPDLEAVFGLEELSGLGAAFAK